jgi:hypothetical protein
MKHKLNEPGSLFGPCEDGCVHMSCELEKQAAKQVCHLCKKSIGYNNEFTFRDEVPVHVKCIDPGSFEDLPDNDEAPSTSKMS